jgi:transcription elongation factor Elf1
MQCIFCKTENKTNAKFCKNCGKILELKCSKCNNFITQDSKFCDRCGAGLQPINVNQKDNSNLKMYKVRLIQNPTQMSQILKYQLVVGSSQQATGEIISKQFGEYEMDKQYGIREVNKGKYPSPNCRIKNTFCKKNIGGISIIIICVTLGLGLIMVPFYPYHCNCQVCGYKWKSKIFLSKN